MFSVQYEITLAHESQSHEAGSSATDQNYSTWWPRVDNKIIFGNIFSNNIFSVADNGQKIRPRQPQL